MIGRRADPLAVICPHCLAGVGSPCVSPQSGRQTSTPHAVRREVAIRLELGGRKRRKLTIEVDMRSLRQLADAVVSSWCRSDACSGARSGYRCLYCGAVVSVQHVGDVREITMHSQECPVRMARKLLVEMDIIRDNEEIRHE